MLRRIWRLPYDSHTRIVHQTANLPSLFNICLDRCFSLLKASQRCSSLLVKTVFLRSKQHSYNFLFSKTWSTIQEIQLRTHSEEKSYGICVHVHLSQSLSQSLWSPALNLISFIHPHPFTPFLVWSSTIITIIQLSPHRQLAEVWGMCKQACSAFTCDISIAQNHLEVLQLTTVCNWEAQGWSSLNLVKMSRQYPTTHTYL
jgi:hypothetical protein